MPLTKLAFVQTTIIAIVIAVAALLAIVGATLWLVGETRTYSDTITQARLQRTAIVELRDFLDDAETGQRGYLLTDDEAYLAPYLAAKAKIAPELDEVRSLLRRDAALAGEFDRLSQIVNAKLAELQETIDLNRTGNRAGALAIVKTDRGRELMDAARQILGALVADSDRRISDAVTIEERDIAALRWVTVLGAIVIFIVVGGCIWLVLRYTRQLVEAQDEVRVLNAGLEERVRDRTAELGRANEEIQRFAYIVTHDLRAPLVNIMGFTSELEANLGAIRSYMESVDESAAPPPFAPAREAALDDLPEAIGFIRSSTRKMDGLINAILKLSREGRRTLKPEWLDLKPLIQTVAASVQHQVTEAGGEISVAGATPSIVSDRLALEQVFGNLFDNAVKYRAPSRPLHIRVRAREEPGRLVVIEVEDNGRGIAAQDHGRVFDLFRRSGTQDQPGEGIGLAYVRTIVRALGGDISLASELDRGTTFTLRIPRDLRSVIGGQREPERQAS